MAGNMYALSLRYDSRLPEKTHEDGVPFFVPQLAKVKTNIVCQTSNKHLLFTYEKATAGSDFAGPTSPTMSYRKQGNQNYYTEENLRKRQKLIGDHKVIAAITRFWDTFPNIRQGQTAIEQRDYIDVFMKFYKALVAPHEFSIGEARKIVERDWARDVGGCDVMSKALFFRSLFEVADIWTTGISAEEYSSFLKKLFDRVTMTIYDQERSLWVTVFAELDKVRSFAEPKEPKGMASAVMLLMTDQGQDLMPPAPQPQKSNTQASSSVSKSRPPLLKKKSLTGNGIASPQKLSSESLTGSGGSLFRRLSEIPPLTSPSAATSSDPVMNEQQTSVYAAESDQRYRVGDIGNNSNGTRGPASLRSPMTKDLGAFDTAVNNNESENPAPGPNTSRRSRLQRNGSLRTELNDSPSIRKSATDELKESGNNTSRAGLQDLPPQPIRLAMPSIYLSPDLTLSNATERAARRHIRQSVKLAQRLRRITF
uniref:Uncharacterized protein n=1 Tax=Globisporangium ultimum (strain ATCC 200006 / CBS 805.95 / DAOM BR144) TaxID=431595 RepID=K3X5K8_GLOUD